jgi:hypothetical protein
MRKFLIPALVFTGAFAFGALAGQNQVEDFPNPASFPSLTVKNGLTVKGTLTTAGTSSSGDGGVSGNFSIGGSASVAGGLCTVSSTGDLSCEDAGILGNADVAGSLTVGGHAVDESILTGQSVATSTTGIIAQTTMLKAGTVRTANNIVVGAGVGGTTITTKLCVDGATCGANNVLVECHAVSCTASNGTVSACTIDGGTFQAGSVLSWSISANGCGTSPTAASSVHLSSP